MPAVKKRLIPILLLVIGLAVVYTVATQKPLPEAKEATPLPPPKVDAISITPEAKKLTVTSHGTAMPKREITLTSEVSGRVVSVSDRFVDGGFVQAGDVLLQIDPKDYEFEVIRAKARLADAERALATELGAARQARREWRDLGNTQANELFLREPQQAAAEAMVESARADVANARLNLQRTTVVAPFNGRVRESLVYAGQFVNRGNGLATLYDTSAAEIRLPLTDRELAMIDLPTNNHDSQQPLPEVTIEGTIGGQTHQWKGSLVRSEAALDMRSRYYYAIAEIQNPFSADNDQTQPLLVGLYVTANIAGRSFDNLVKVPNSAIFDRNQLFTLDAEQKAHQQTVALLSQDSDFSWIQFDQKEQTHIVLNNQLMLYEGLIVSPTVVALDN